MSEQSTTKHTPGPWLEPGTFGASRFEVQGGHPTRRIAVVDRIEDARLIAAAPETAEKAMAFTMLVERFVRGNDIGDPRKPVTESELAEAMYALRAHIAKATGTSA